jgi:hypothetical protein
MFNDYAQNQVDLVNEVQCCWPSCGATSGPEIPLCEAHFREVGLRFIDECTVGGTTFRVVQEREKQTRHEDLLASEIERGRLATEHRAALAATSVVYYVRSGRYVKIGFTSDLKRRLSELRLHSTAVLATEPGGRAVEADRHAEFADERIDPRREDFALSLRIQEHIRELQETVGSR